MPVRRLCRDRSNETLTDTAPAILTQIQRVNWESGPSPQGALDIIRIAMKRQTRQLAIQHNLINRQLRLADTGVKQITQQHHAPENAQGTQRAERIEGKLGGYEQEVNRWPVQSTPKPAPVTGRGANAGRFRHPLRTQLPKVS
jgi:hypothetical protein